MRSLRRTTAIDDCRNAARRFVFGKLLHEPRAKRANVVNKARLSGISQKEITGGDPKQYVGEFGEMAIVKTVKENNAVPSHYLRRPSGTVNILYSVPGFGLGGQGLDSFLVSDSAIFRPAKGAK